VAVRGLPPLTAAEQAALECDYRYGRTRLLRQRSQIVLLAYELNNQTAVGRSVRCSRATVNRTLQRYRAGGRAALPRPDHHRTAAQWKQPLWRARLTRTMEAGPRACGVPRPTWTAPLLARYLTEQTGFRTGERTVRRGLADLGFVCRRGTWTVRHKAEEQPDYRPKRRGSRRS
jgi:transposase